MKNFLLVLCIGLISCHSNKDNKAVVPDSSEKKDPHSYSDPDAARVKHLDLELNVNFDNHIISGKAVWLIEKNEDADSIVFDTRQLQIENVILDDSKTKAIYSEGKEDKFLGKPLSIKLEEGTRKVTVWYKTSKDAAALQWLNPQQTAGKKMPFLYTQSQAILARTWIPCQDSPGIRFTYTANVTVPKEMFALMSAENPQKKSSDGKYHFKQVRPIPSYLMALTVGDLSFKKIDNRTGIYAETVTLADAAWEFADAGKMVNAAEKLYGPYQWGRYDILVLPPSFPFGGMENPMLTFATPTVLAGDRSLVSLIAHELAHSWSGNLVTNATWNDFWLNEGFTTYFERRIIEAVYGEDEAKMQEVLGFKLLKASIAEIGEKNDDTKLKGNFEGRDPDDGVTDIPYEKGYAFLKVIENAIGRTQFDGFLLEYFKTHKFQSLTTEDFVLYLQKNLIAKEPQLSDKIKVSEWLYEPGLPSNAVIPKSEKFQEMDSLIASWKGAIKTNGLSRIKSTNEKLYLIGALPDSLSVQEMELLDREFTFTTSGNAEIQAAWYLLAIRHSYTKAYPQIEKFLINVGRRKFLLPLYKEMVKTTEGKTWAKKVYEKARPNYHSVTFTTIDEILK